MHEPNRDELPEPLALTPKQAQAALNIGETKLYELLKSGALKRIKIGNATRIPFADIKRVAAEGA